MDMDYARFVTVWTQAPSLEVASTVLGMSTGRVLRQAEMMRAAGIPLKDLGDMRKGRGETTREQTNDSPVLPLAEATSNETTKSYVSLLKTDAQLRFYAKYTVGRNGGPSLAESVAHRHALRSGASGSAGIASGVVEDAAHEAIAQLAVAPPEGFDGKHPGAGGFVVRHIQHAVRTRLNREFGRKGKRFGGHVPTNAVEVVGREPDPSAPVDYSAALASMQAREAEKVRQLERVRTALPGGVLPTTREGRIATLWALGECISRATASAAEHRFYSTLAGHVRAELGLEALRSPDEVPSSIRQRLAPPQPKSRQQREAEQFVVAWQTSTTAQEVARRLNKSVRTVTSFAGRLRQLGVPLKNMPTHCGALVRGVRALVPSIN